MLADIANGKTDLADVLFLVAFIVFLIGTILVLVARPVVVPTVCLLAGLAALALAWMVL